MEGNGLATPEKISGAANDTTDVHYGVPIAGLFEPAVRTLFVYGYGQLLVVL